ncbi:MAG TPA: hypothetical protein VEK79_06970 [Thermoanaerobaculia bacterium]|nr:hypothetical protein [Thermoanaerobaculia bacterium]
MNVEITISGLCVIALEADPADPKPEHPRAIDIIVPDAHHHTCRWSYLPGEVFPSAGTRELPDMVIDPVGTRVASLSLQGRALEFRLDGNTVTEHTVRWGPDAEAPASDAETEWLNWIPKLQDLGFSGFTVGPAGQLPPHARARITLPKGTLTSRNVIADRFTNDVIVWEFPATGARHVLTNEIVFMATGEELSVIENGNERWAAALGPDATLRMCISHETTSVPLDYGDPNNVLAHLHHFDVLTGDVSVKFREPIVAEIPRTGRPICMGVVFVHGGGA